MSSDNDLTNLIDLRDGGLNLDIHGRVHVRVAPETPSMDILRTMFAPFIVDEMSGTPDILVVEEHPNMVDPSHNEHEYRYTDDAVWLAPMNVQITRESSMHLVSGTRELLTAVLPVVDIISTRRGAAMVHATMVDIGGRGVLMPAWGGVGKTSTMAKLLARDDCQFMGDDWGLLDDSGTLLGYAKPMFIKPHHRPIYPHLFEGRRKPLVPSRLSKPIGKATTIVHPLVTKFPKVAAFSRQWSPEHKMVTPQEAFPNAGFATTAPLCASVFVERFDGDSVVIEERDTPWMVDRLVGNFHCELPQHSRDVLTALSATGIVAQHDIQATKAKVVVDGLGDTPGELMKVPAAWSADKASDAISEYLVAVAERSPAMAG